MRLENLRILPESVHEWNGLLREKPVDLNRVSSVAARDVSLSSRLIQVCNITQMGSSGAVSSTEEAIILAGAERVRILLLMCALFEYAVPQVPFSETQAFWRHSLLTALLSRQAARRNGSASAEKAYLAGFLHDAGAIPFLGLIPAEDADTRREGCFGPAHCDAGQSVGLWAGLDPEWIDVLAHHHAPGGAEKNRGLVTLVAAADDFAERKGVGLFSFHSPSLKMEEIPRLARALEEEFELYFETGKIARLSRAESR